MVWIRLWNLLFSGVSAHRSLDPGVRPSEVLALRSLDLGVRPLEVSTSEFGPWKSRPWSLALGSLGPWSLALESLGPRSLALVSLDPRSLALVSLDPQKTRPSEVLTLRVRRLGNPRRLESQPSEFWSQSLGVH